MALEYRHGSRTGLNPGPRSEHHPLTQLPPRSTRRISEFDIWFLEFSNLYSLNLRRPNSSFSIEQTRFSPYYQEEWYYTALRDQYRQGNAEIILKTFDKEARAIHSRWVKKSKADLDLTPTYTNLPRAATEPERAHLLRRLMVILENLGASDESQSSANGAEDYSAGPELSVAEEPLSPSALRRSKRSSDDWLKQNSSPKRSRATDYPSRPQSVLSRLDSGEVRSATPLPEPHRSLPVRDQRSSSQQHASFGHEQSFDTNKSSFVSTVFTDAEDFASALPDTQETEVTIEEATSQHRANSQHKINSQHKSGSQQAPKSFQPSMPSAPSVVSPMPERALRVSFTERNNLQQDVANLLQRNMRPGGSPSDRNDGVVDLQSSQHNRSVSDIGDFTRRLEDVWPKLPSHLEDAPLAVRWEVVRVSLHCGVSLEDLKNTPFRYDPKLDNQNILWERLRGLSIFEGKIFPEKSKPEAWAAAMSERFSSTDQTVILTAFLTVNSSPKGPLFKLGLQPLKLDLPHRLDRRFGSDRFFELLVPSIHSRDMENLKKSNSAGIDTILDWLTRERHVFLGRVWRSFFTKDGSPRKMHKDDTLKKESDVVTVFQERVYFFAENGNDFVSGDGVTPVSPALESWNRHTKMDRKDLINWLLQLQKYEKNRKQPVCKLFSRLALGLSRTHATVVLEPDQIRHLDQDILSPTKKVMNDGIARMSTALAHRIRNLLGLDDTPAGYQGRFGSAKGFWIRDTDDRSDEIWIETFPSQRKWECDYEEEYHRTFEVLKEAKDLRSATLNLQLLPILEDRAKDRVTMKQEIGRFMRESLEAEMKSQKEAMTDASRFRLWVHENAAPQRRQDRIRTGCVPWLGGLPTSKEDQMELLLSQGFDPMKLEFLRNIAYQIRKTKCDELQTKLNVKVGRSTYAYMTVDFLGVLEEGEVHMGFSSKFTDEASGFSETFLHGMDLLVARTPAHYPSDIQRVKAVFKPELGSLKDVIVFSIKGNTPLADKLSGGDYDGDMAWICWEPTIVENFENAEVPKIPDLIADGVLKQRKDTYKALAASSRDVTTEFIDQAFRFNMEQSLLGACTNYKEKFCYSRKAVGDEPAVYLSTLISQLVDRAKQGIIFSEGTWNKLRRERFNTQQGQPKLRKAKAEPPVPEYKKQHWERAEEPSHIIDYVKFIVGKPTVENELKALNQYLGTAEMYDKDLVKFYDYFANFKRPIEQRRKDELQGKRKNTWETILDELKKSIDAVHKEWTIMVQSSSNFETTVATVYEKWKAIKLTEKVASNSARSLCEESLAGIGLSQWDLLKASYCFKMYHKKTFPWYIAGYQLAYLKSIVVSGGKPAPPILMTPEMYAGVKPDAKFVRAVAARNEGLRFQGAAEELEDYDDSIEDDV